MPEKKKSLAVDGRTLRHQHRRPALLNAVTEYILDNGVGDLSLRPIASAIGVTHSTLLRHFSSKEQLLLEVLQKIRIDFEAQISADAQAAGTLSAIDQLRLTWQRLGDPRERRQFSVLYELVSRAPHSDGQSEPLVQEILNDWTQAVANALHADGWSRKNAAMRATLLLAFIRGLQIEVLMTGDPARITRINKAFEQGIALLMAEN